ncbi:PREDICTED: uncharacterized protein LOC108779658 [Cyphomyrmex costatus]|nr:PREDICTED: uncharacterized protein LOC108779658 [Cyphomyrmex costatus]
MSSIELVKQLIKVINRFKFEELESAVIPVFPETSWTSVRSKLIKNHKHFTVPNVTHVIRDVLDNVNLNVKDLQNRLTMLTVTDISRHSYRKIWYGYKLIGLNEKLKFFDKQKMQKNIQMEFSANDLNADVKTIMYNSIMFVSINEKRKKQKKAKQFSTPIYFALFLGHNYFFCSRKCAPNNYVKAIAISLGYNSCKTIKLMGKDLKSLMKLLWMKQQNVLQAENISQPPVYQPSDPIISNNGIDFTQNKQRKKYVEQCYGENPPILEKLVIKGPIESIQHDCLASKLPTNSIRMNWEFRSHNMARFLTTLIERHAFTLPLPEYVSDLMILGKNELTLRTDQS